MSLPFSLFNDGRSYSFNNQYLDLGAWDMSSVTNFMETFAANHDFVGAGLGKVDYQPNISLPPHDIYIYTY